MSETITEAEQALALCLEAMHDALQFTIEDALPQSTLAGPGAMDVEDDDIPDTLRQSLEWERGEEVKRVGDKAREVQRRLELLRRCVVVLGGGNAQQAIQIGSPVVDIPVGVLDQEIAVLSAESARLGNLMVERYEETKMLAAKLESEITNAKVPPL